MSVIAKSGAASPPRGSGIERHVFHGHQVLQNATDRLPGTPPTAPASAANRRNSAANPDAKHLLTGLRGEEEALFHLRKHGYTVVARRWQTPRLPGDVDLIAWEGDTLCFIEVKTRTGRDIVPAEFAVDAHKQNTLRTLASVFLKRFPEATRRTIPVRFDVVAVYLPAPASTGEPSGPHAPKAAVEFDLFPDAFSR